MAQPSTLISTTNSGYYFLISKQREVWSWIRKSRAPHRGAKGEDGKNGVYKFPIADFFDKCITMGSGHAPVKKYNEYLWDLIVNGRIRPSKIVSHHVNIEDASDAYSKFDQRIEGYTKVLIRFNRKAA